MELETEYKKRLSLNGKTFCTYRSVRAGVNLKHNLKFTVLPHHLFQRLPDTRADAFVKHLLTPKNEMKKISYLKKHGYYIDESIEGKK